MVMARSVLDVIAESDKEKKIITIEKNHDHFLNAKKNFELNQLDHLIDAYCGDAKNVLENLKGQICFDLIFIDADKASSEFYLDFARNHLSENGLIIIDNIFLHLKNNEKFSKNSKIYQSLELTIEKIKNEYDSIVIPYKRDDSEDALCLAKLRK
jgi:predicted O-methyltransferase YrrM